MRFSEKAGGVLFQVRVQPRSSRNRVGSFDGGLKVTLKAAPVDNAANRECCLLLARLFGVPPSRVSITAGGSSRNKTVRIEGMTMDDAARILEQEMASG